MDDVAVETLPRELAGVDDPVGFGAALRRVRLSRGLTLRGVEGYLRGLPDRTPDRWSKSKIEQAEKGQALEERWVLRYLSALGVPGPELPPWVMALRRALDQEPETAGTVEEASPFPGLRAFGVEQHRVFFARNREIAELADLLRSPAERTADAMVLVVGPSGSGKSSLLRAGLVPTMAAEPGWAALAPFWPGSDPIGALARELCALAGEFGLEWSLPDLRRRLEDDDGAGGGLVEPVEELLLAAPGPRRTRLLIAVDQFEELLTHAPAPARARFVALLRSVLAGPVAVAATLSPEFLDRLLRCPELSGLATRTVTVRPLERDALAVVIEQPARVAGIAVEPELVARLVADTAGGDALPLLAYTLAQLAEGVGHGGRLDAARYDQLGGVHGTLARQAEQAFGEAVATGGRGRDEVIASLLRLVTVDEDGRPARRRIPRGELPAVVVTELEPFLARRLLSTDADRDGVTIQVAHEAFLSAWAPLARAIADNSAALRARRAVEQAAAVWHEHQHAPNRLWERGQLAAALADTGAHRRATTLLGTREVVTERVTLSPAAREFLGASIRRDGRRRGRISTVLALMLVLALSAAGLAVAGLSTSLDQQRLATARLLVSRAEAARATDQRAALLLGETAEHIYPDAETRASLTQTLLANRYRAALVGHTDHVDAVAYSPDGRMLATGSADQTVILWDLTDPGGPRRVGAPLAGYGAAVTSVAFSPDGRTLATGSNVGAVVLWDLTDPAAPRRAAVPGHTGPVHSVAFSPDGRTVATGGEDRTVLLWDVSDRAAPRRAGALLGHTDAVRAVAFSPDGHTLASGSADHTAALWDVTDRAAPVRRAILPGHTRSVYSVAFSPDGRTLATGGFDTTAIVWDLSDPAAPRQRAVLTGHTSTVLAVAFSPDGRTLATGSADNTGILWDLAAPGRPRQRATLAGHTSAVNALAFAPDGRTLATGSADRTAVLWDLAVPGQPRQRTTLGGHSSTVYAVAFSRDGRILASGSDDHTVLLRDATDPAAPPLGPPLRSHGGSVISVAFSPDGRTLAMGSDDRTVVLWDLSDPSRPRERATLTGHAATVHAVAFSPDGRTLATGSNDDTVMLWDLTDPAAAPRPRATLRGHGGPVASVAFSPDGHTLATGSADQTARLWDVADPARPVPGPVLAGHTDTVQSVAFSPDGRTLATGSYDSTVGLWDLADPGRPAPLPALRGHTRGVTAVAFSPDGRELASVSADSTAILWDRTAPGGPGRGPTLAGHGSAVTSVAFSPDGGTLATGGSDAAVVLWDDLTAFHTVRDQAVQRACAVTGGGMSPADWARDVPGVDYEDACAPG